MLQLDLDFGAGGSFLAVTGATGTTGATGAVQDDFMKIPSRLSVGLSVGLSSFSVSCSEKLGF